MLHRLFFDCKLLWINEPLWLYAHGLNQEYRSIVKTSRLCSCVRLRFAVKCTSHLIEILKPLSYHYNKKKVFLSVYYPGTFSKSTIKVNLHSLTCSKNLSRHTVHPFRVCLFHHSRNMFIRWFTCFGGWVAWSISIRWNQELHYQQFWYKANGTWACDLVLPCIFLRTISQELKWIFYERPTVAKWKYKMLCDLYIRNTQTAWPNDRKYAYLYSPHHLECV